MSERAPPEVLLPYQQEIVRLTQTEKFLVCEKSRRIGISWAVAAAASLLAGADRSAGGQDVFYIAYNLTMTRTFIEDCAMWSKSFLGVAAEVGEFLFLDVDERGETREIQAYRIRYASGFEIQALSSRPRSLRSRQGYVIIDEAAYHDELREVLKAAMALLIWGGRVLAISTHNGDDNPFNELITEIRAERRAGTVFRVTFRDAIDQGLYRRICLTRGIEWTEEGELAWEQEIRALNADAASEELDCVPSASGGRWLTRVLLEARVQDVHVAHWKLPAEWVDVDEDSRVRQTEQFCTEEILPHLGRDGSVTTSVGGDFGRSGNLSVFWVLATRADLQRETLIVVELENVPFRAQEQVLFYLVDRLSRCTGVALDARGNGQYLAEAARQKYGPEFVAEVMLTEGWYREHGPPVKADLEEGALSIPRDAEIVADLRSLVVVRGVARPPDKERASTRGKRHADAAVALLMAMYAARQIDAGPIDVTVQGESTAALAWGDGGDFHSKLAGYS